MENKKILFALEKQFNEEYYLMTELIYSNKVGIFLSPYEYKEFIEYKDELAKRENPFIQKLPLPVFNYKCLYYSKGKELDSIINSYLSITDDGSNILDDFSSSFIDSRIYSEIEGTLNVESVPTTRRRLKELLEDNAPIENQNDIIIKNMKAGIDFVHTLPAFNEDNLFALYSLLSKDCLKDDDKLKPGDHYRYDTVEISRYHGCPVNQIKESLDALFEYVSTTLKKDNIKEITMLPHICHYYILYIHPYFDYNGRTARMVSYWVYLLSGQRSFPPIVSEAINQTKNQYYKAIEFSRDAHNDVTFFLKYIFGISIDYYICYQNLNHFSHIVKSRGGSLTETELNYLKRILISYKGPFNHSDFLKMANVTMSKQGALKTLNHFVNYGILMEIQTTTKTKIFDLNKNNVPYSLRNYGYKI